MAARKPRGTGAVPPESIERALARIEPVAFPGTPDGNRTAELDFYILNRVTVVEERLRLAELSVQKLTTLGELRGENEAGRRESRHKNLALFISILAVLASVGFGVLNHWWPVH